MEKTSFIKKIWLGTVSGLVTGFVFFRIGSKYLSIWLPMPIIILLAVIFLLSALIASLLWQRIKPLLEYAMIYLLALDLTLFGWQKILHIQMIVPLGIMDNPFNSLGGETLMWAFFKWSYPFTLVIACTQLICACLLLFTRTRLLALVMIVPLLVNIACLDYFYDLPRWVLIHALVLLSGVIYLLALDYARLITFFSGRLQGLTELHFPGSVKNGFKLSILVLPLIFFLNYDFPDKNPELTGKYQVKDLQVNGQKEKAVSPKDSVLTNVYMDLDNDFVFEFNDYRYRYIGTYSYKKGKDAISVKWRYPKDAVPFSGKLIWEKTGLSLKGRMGKDVLNMKLKKTQ